jgi:hypothetical protein
MDTIKEDRQADEKSTSTEAVSRPAAEHPTESPWSALTRQLGTLAMTAIFGTAVGYYFQQRAWNNDKAVTQIQNDANTAFDVGQKVSEFIDVRWATADQLRDALKPRASREEWDYSRNKYSKNFEEWQSNLAKWAGQIAFHVDTPFRLPTDDKRKEIASITCLTYTLNFKSDNNEIDYRSASHLLQIIDHCHDLAKNDVEGADADKHPVKAPISCEKTAKKGSDPEKHLCDFATRQSHIWWLNNVLRCTILQRAVSIRDNVAKTFWDRYIMPHAPSKYSLSSDELNPRPQGPPDEDSCVWDYYNNDRYGYEAAKSLVGH